MSAPRAAVVRSNLIGGPPFVRRLFAARETPGDGRSSGFAVTGRRASLTCPGRATYRLKRTGFEEAPMAAIEPAITGPATSTAPRGFPLNAWYAAAWSHEIKRELTARTICNKDIVLYRRTDGQAAALEDACWHRLVPLSLGRLKGDDVQCGYHGIEFNSEGRCTFMPAQKTINPSACVRAFPVIERHRMVWVWPGDPALADPAKMPDFHWNDGTEWVG